MRSERSHRAVGLCVVVHLACLLSAQACDDNGPSVVPVALATEPTLAGDGATMTEITATDAHFNPSRVYARPGQRLRIVLRNEGSLHHNLKIDLPTGPRALSSDVLPNAQGEMIVEVPNEPGELRFYCPIGNNRDVGMAGTLIVETPAVVSLTEVVSGLVAPVALVELPGGDGRKLIVDRVGLVHVLRADGALAPEPFLDLRERLATNEPFSDERGLLGLSLHPRFAENGRIFVHYSAARRADAPSEIDHTNRVAELHLAEDERHVSLATERVLVDIDQAPTSRDGGTLAFGPKDALLYVSVGGGDAASLGGSVLRIDVDRGVPYAIPADNPFASGGGAPEIYAFGFHDPRGFSFDVDGDVTRLFVADAGRSLWEEVNLVERGGNYGWNVREGADCVALRTIDTSPATCASVGPGGEPLRAPIVSLPHASQIGGLGASIVGGYVYRGRGVPALAGRYVFGVWSRRLGEPDGALFMAERAPGAPATDLWPIRPVDVAGGPEMGGGVGRFILGLAQTADGELWVLTSDVTALSGTTGRVFRLKAVSTDRVEGAVHAASAS